MNRAKFLFNDETYRGFGTDSVGKLKPGPGMSLDSSFMQTESHKRVAATVRAVVRGACGVVEGSDETNN